MVRMNRTSPGLSQMNGYHGDDVRRRVAGCRDRLRRHRAARRITERAAPSAAEVTVEASEAETASEGREARKEKG